jgi:hypothetical protein
MKRSTSVILGSLALLAIASGVPAKEGSHTLLAFDTMYGVDGPFIGETNAIRGVVGDELPWVLRVGKGTLKTNGHLKMKIRGLVFKNDPSVVPPEKIGINDSPQFRALVSCLTEQGSSVASVSVTSTGFAATTSGNSEIDTMLTLPNPCVAPVVFVMAGDEDKWFAVVGFESEE